MDNEYYRKITTTVILAVLIVLAFFLVRPILLSIIMGIILAFLFMPIYNRVYKILKSKNLSATLMCLLLLAIIFVPIWYLTPIMINQSIKFYLASQQIDFVTSLKSIFPSLFQSETFSAEIGSTIQSFVTKSTNSLMNSLSNIILNFPRIFLNVVVIFFIFFFTLRDRDSLLNYVRSLLPFSKEVEKKIFHSSKNITLSILYGQVVIGIVQGVVAGLGFFIFKVPNALLLTVLAAIAGIFPVIGTAVVWIPVAIYFIIAGNTFSALGIIVFGIISTVIETLLKPIFVSRRTQLNSSVILIGMLGGLFLFGILGLILGPLILAYLLIVLEIYRDKKIPGIFIQEPGKK